MAEVGLELCCVQFDGFQDCFEGYYEVEVFVEVAMRFYCVKLRTVCVVFVRQSGKLSYVVQQWR
jgi:hypothetical protein